MSEIINFLILSTMKTKLLLLTVLASIFAAQAQDRTSINAMNSEISDNLDLRAVADIFGDSKNIQDGGGWRP